MNIKQGVLELLTKHRKGTQVLLALLGTYGCLYLGELSGALQIRLSVAGVFLLCTVYCLLVWTWNKLSEIAPGREKSRRISYAAAVSFLFSLTMILGYQLQTNGHTDYGVPNKFLILVKALFLSIAVFPFGNLLFDGIERIGMLKRREGRARVWKSGFVFGASALFIFACLIPVWLAYYPIIMSFDFHRQVNEAVKGFIWFNPYQPLAHTWVIWCFVQLGYRLGDLQAGMAGMALFQMLLYSLVTAYACAFLYRCTKRRWTVVAAVLFFGIFPLNSVLVLCTTKDVLFSVLFLLFCLLLAERTFFGSGRKQLVLDVLLVLEGCIMLQFRNNAIYALAVYAVFWLIFAAKKEKLRVLALCALLLMGGKGTSVVIKEALGTEIQAPKVEMYSVPIQQFVRVGHRYGADLDPDMWLLINSYASSDFWYLYNPSISDAVKSHVGIKNFPYTWEGHELQLFKDWLTVGLEYPNEYIDAFLELTRGYWFIDDKSYAECLGLGREGRMGVIYTYNSASLDDGGEILHETKFPWLEDQLENIVSANAFYSWPLLSQLFKCAFYFWGLVLVILAYIYLGKRRQALFGGFALLYMATMFLGPVVQIRYIFPVMLVFPVLLSLLLLPKEGAEKIAS